LGCGLSRDVFIKPGIHAAARHIPNPMILAPLHSKVDGVVTLLYSNMEWLG
jgi:hypothetical protein